MAKASPQQLALQALARAVNDPRPKVLYGSKSKPGIFEGTVRAYGPAARHCQEQGWIEGTGQYEGTGKSRKELYRISAAGIKAALEHAEPVVLLAESLNTLKRVDEALKSMQNQKELVGKLLERVQPPNLDNLLKGVGSDQAGGSRPPSPAAADDSWLAQALDYLREHQKRNPYANCPLPELYHHVAEPRGLTIGQFHDGLRRLVEQRRVRLHPFTGAAYQLKDEQYALVAGQEIKYYAERLASN